jgi:glucose-1-phosphate thymidylyltransferase
VTYAIIDAAAGDEAQASARAERSRYCTPIANLPLIFHVFDELAASGVDRARVIAAPAVRDELVAVVGDGRAWDVEVSYAESPDSDGRLTVLDELERAAAAEPVLVYPGDSLFPGQIGAMWERFNAGDVDAVVLGGPRGVRGPIPLGPAAAHRRATRLCATPAILGPPGIGALRISGPEDQDLAEWLRMSDRRVGVCELGGHWRYSDATEDLLTANRMMLDALPVPSVDGTFPDDNEVHGRVAISPSARVSGCTLHGPVAIDDDAVVEDSFVGPYTAIGAGAVLMGTEIDNTMVLRRAEIRHPGHRIEASIIGEQASVLRSFALPKGLHMRLEPHSRVTLS